jgi:hypothetical protein
VDGEAKAMAGAMEETRRALRRVAGFIVTGGEGRYDSFVDGAPSNSGADGFKCGKLGGTDCLY